MNLKTRAYLGLMIGILAHIALPILVMIYAELSWGLAFIVMFVNGYFFSIAMKMFKLRMKLLELLNDNDMLSKINEMIEGI